MRIIWTTALVMSVTLAAQPTSTFAGSVNSDGLQWHQDVKAAWQVTQTTRRPLLVFFKSDGCIYCQRMQQNTLSDQRVRYDLRNYFVPVMIDARSAPRLVSQWGIRAFPTTVVISPDSRVMAKVTGYTDVDSFRNRLWAGRPPQPLQR